MYFNVLEYHTEMKRNLSNEIVTAMHQASSNRDVAAVTKIIAEHQVRVEQDQITIPLKHRWVPWWHKGGSGHHSQEGLVIFALPLLIVVAPVYIVWEAGRFVTSALGMLYK